MKKIFRALFVTLLIGPYAGLCIAAALFVTGAAVPPLHTAAIFFPVAALSTITVAIRIFIVQIKRPS